MTTPAVDTPLPLRVYRGACLSMLRRYYDMSHELGRLPSVLGREQFRPQITTIHEAWFEDSVIYVCDVEHCLESLAPQFQEIIKRLVFQEYTQDEVARMLRLSDRHVRRLLLDAIDTLSQMFLDRDLMVLPQRRRHMMAYDVLLEEPEDDVALADALSESSDESPLSISASSDTTESPGSVSRRNDEPWLRLPVEISCQDPFLSQIEASL